MKRASYRSAVAWIALNDEPGCRDTDTVSGFVSVVLTADLFAVEPQKVAADVVRYREREKEPALRTPWED